MSMLRKIQRVGKRASKFQYTATYQSVVVECTTKDKWRPQRICVSWTRRGRRFISQLRPWQPSPDNKARGVVIWPEPEIMEITVTLYKGPKEKSYENKEWEFAVIDVDSEGKRKVLATGPINMVRYVSALPYEHDLHLRLKPVSKKIKAVILEVSITSEFLKEGKATDDDMMSIASMMSISNLSTIGFLEDDEDEDYNYYPGGRSISPPEMVPNNLLSTDGLLKWAQEITRDLPGVKITNMTTSWRSGMAFLAIIHYFRPDLMDFDMQSPNSIKENNRNAFNIARSLGIACPLTPNMMVTTTIPDKLAVTSFVYQMYQYFTKATQSAISRAKLEEEGKQNGSRGTSPSSPFDISKFDMFSSSNISPVTTPPPRADRVMQYSRHSKENLRRQSEPDVECPLDMEDVQSNSGAVRHQSTPNVDSTKVQRSGVLGGGDPPPVSPRTAAKLRLDQIITEHAQMSRTEHGDQGAEVSSFEQDRELEFENANTDTESSRTESAASLLENKSAMELPSEIRPVNSSSADLSAPSEDLSIYKYMPGQGQTGSKKVDKPAGGRKLPSVPSYTSSPKITSKREEIRKQAQEMLKKHKLDKLKFSPHNVSSDALDPQSTSIYRRKAIEMLSEAFSSPTSSSTDLTRDRDELASEGSSTSLGVTSTDEELSSSRSANNLLAADRLVKKPVSASDLRVSSGGKAPVGTGKDTPTGRERVAGSETKRKTSKSSESRTGNKKRNSLSDMESKMEAAEPVKRKLMSPRRSSEGNLLLPPKKQVPDSPLKESRKTAESGVKTRRQRKLSAEPLDGSVVGVGLSESPPPSSDHPKGRVRSATLGNVTRDSNSASSATTAASAGAKKRPLKPAPVARPIPAQPSQALRRMAEQKRLEEEKREREEREREEREREEMERAIAVQAAKKQESEPDGATVAELEREEGEEVEGRESLSLKDSVGTPATNGTPTHKKSLPSPSAWSQHSEDISQDLLVTQSEYVKTELLSLQAQTQDLENRAKDIEMNIRVAMSEGQKESEEELMQEWFGLLNRKNELIKRQIELNLIEKEEDLEKRQFFLNRELRPLMEIPEDEKAGEQKAREEHLLRELFELIDERDKLERKKMANMKNAHNERTSFAVAQAKSADIVNRPANVPGTRSGSKDCVIS